jgi:hypothetical protein
VVADADADVMEPTLWKSRGWVARVIKNEDDDGWAVEMTRSGDNEPALVGPWTMGRDKRNPKPMNPKDFGTLVKTASEVLERAMQHAKAQRHRSIIVSGSAGMRFRVELDIALDEDDPHAMLSCFDDVGGERLSHVRVEANFKLSQAAAEATAKAAHG